MPNIEVNGKIYSVTVVKTDEEKEKGLQGIDNLPENEGMLFCYDPPESVNYWMKDVPISLDIIFIDEYGEVISVTKGEPNDETPIQEDNVAYVLEVNSPSGISEGDDVDLSEVEEEMEYMEDESEENEESSTKMIVLGKGGEVQMELSGGERIFSRKSTMVMIRKAKKAYRARKDPEKYKQFCKSLGKYIFEEIDAQDKRDPEYTSI